MTPISLERVRVRSRLLERGISVGAVASAAAVDRSFASRVLAFERPATTDAGQRVIRAAEDLSGLTWRQLSAPRRRAAA